MICKAIMCRVGTVLVTLVLVLLPIEACPDMSQIASCHCRQHRDLNSLPDLICETKEVDMRQVMSQLNQQNVLHFGKLLWLNGIKTHVDQFFFGNVTFKEMHLGNQHQFCNISHFSPKAFVGPISETVRTLQVRSLELRNDNDLYAAIRTLINLEELTIEGRYLERIPPHAFVSPDTTTISKLSRISFNGGEFETIIFVTKIEHHAFAGLPYLSDVYFHQQDVDYIGDFAFALNQPSDRVLKLNLSLQWNSNFTENSFSDKALSGINRPIELDLYGNSHIKHLPKHVFKPFLDVNHNTTIRLGMKMHCDCQMYWLYRDWDQYRKQFVAWSYEDTQMARHNFTIHCGNVGDIDLFEISEEHFESCHSTLDLPREEL